MKIVVKLILSRLPFNYRVWQRIGLFRHGNMDRSGYAIRVFSSHVEKSGLTNQAQGKTIVELGSGDSIATAIIAAAHGARAILIDTGAYVRIDLAPYHELRRVLAEQGLSPPDLSTCSAVEDVLSCCNAQYFTNGLSSLKCIEKHSVDLIFSQAVLEHIRTREFLDTMRECRRILKPGGVCSHQIDLRDHLGGALNNLRFSERVWESRFFAASGFYTNRIRYREMMDLFAQAGFVAECTAVQRWEKLPTPRSRITSQFARIPDDELCIAVFDVLLR